MKFRGHSVQLPDGSLTIKDSTAIAESRRFKSAVQTILSFFPERDVTALKLADYGCFEGGFSLEFARLGIQVVGIEAREENLKRADYLKERWQVPNLQFIEADVRELPPSIPFDISFVSGLLYHLERPVEFLNYLYTMTDRLLILNTHFSGETVPSRFRHKLSKMTKHEGYRGRWYSESENTGDQQEFPRSSVGNQRSFWLTRASLLQALRDVGFNLIFEQYDCHYDMDKAEIAIRRNSRSQFIAVK